MLYQCYSKDVYGAFELMEAGKKWGQSVTLNGKQGWLSSLR